MQGIGAPEARGFWADAWSRVIRRPAAIFALAWLALVAFFAMISPLIASGHPLVWRDRSTTPESVSFPLWNHLSAADILLPIGALGGTILLLLPLRWPRSERALALFAIALQAGLTILASSGTALVLANIRITGDDGISRRLVYPPLLASSLVALAVGLFALALPLITRRAARAIVVVVVALASAAACHHSWTTPLVDFDRYALAEAAGTGHGTYTLIPWSPTQGRTDLYLQPPGTTLAQAQPDDAQHPFASRPFRLGTDPLGRDVLSQLLHACRLSISIGLVSTGIAVAIGVTLGAIMGYFGGWIEILLFRVVEVFMAIPVLFLLIVAVGVLPGDLRSTYVLMAVIGCVSWTGAARFTRAEFLRLRDQDFVQAARAAGLPLRSILFRHMLPNGVTPVLVDASFAIAAAILAEATLSYLGLGPPDQPSWGKLLASATGTVGDFIWWLAVFPGVAIFLTVLSYNLLGEALRDAIDPKLRKARV
jgi:peptide/nickel transport system permease protein